MVSSGSGVPKRQGRARGSATVVLVASGLTVISLLSSAAGGARKTENAAPPRPAKNLLLGGSKYTGTPTEQPVVKLGWVSDAAGRVGTYGPNMIRAARLMVELMNKNGGILGHPVEFFSRDSQTDAAIAFREARDLIVSEKITAMFNGVLGNESLAILPLVQRYKVPFIAGGDGTIAIVGKQASIYQGMVDATSQTEACGFAKYQALKHPDWRRVALLEVGGNFGEEHGAFFAACLQKFAPRARIVVKKSFPGGTPNFVPYITALLAAKPDIIVSTTFGTDTVRFYKQYVGAGAPIPYATFMDLDTAKALGNGIRPNLLYGFARAFYPAIPTTQPWVAAFRKKYHVAPADYGLTMIGAMLAYKAAVEKAGTLDSGKVMEAFRCLRYYEPRGWVKIRTLNGQGDTAEYMGLMTPNKKLGFPTMTGVVPVYGHQVWQSDRVLRQTLPDSAERDAKDCK